MQLDNHLGSNLSIVTDGTSNTFTVSISELCLAMNIADLSPIDAVSPMVQFNGPSGPMTGTLTLNSKGTVVTANFATTPPAGNYSFGFEALRNI